MVDIKGYGSDRYGRILGEIYIGDKNVNLEMVKTGYAEVYSGRPPRGFYLREYEKAEIWAKHANRGIWSQGEEYISPAFWRKNQKKGQKKWQLPDDVSYNFYQIKAKGRVESE